ncbi:SANT/Myb domain [Macleaya cordata]|uniref:SANT/Myb domain n=1 Tax=Macleaya cordata TaxID=56857 RepID=A0A200QGQ9_MACCD|nr:SANT/Myb domain [Macleaya cordata]
MEMIEEANSKPFPANEPEHDLYTIPTCSSWFSWDEIHETEKTSLKEFFDGSSISRTPKVYKEYRDFIINKYREDPSRKLTFTEIRKSLIGDVSVVHKVFLFLEKWGLINFSVASSLPDNPMTLAVDEEKEKLKVKFEEGAPHGIRVVAVPNSLKVVSLSQNANDAVETLENSFRLPPLASYSDVFGDLMRQKELVCGTCGEDCSSGFYESHKRGLVICAKCFKNQGESKSVDDFEFQDCKVSLNNLGADMWTEAETLLLLESVLKHGDDWDLVAQNVRTKNKFECISKLIELPFGELMLSMANGKGDERNSASDAGNVKLHEPTSVGLREAIKEEDQYHEHMNETEQTGEGGTEEPPLKRRCIAPFADSGGSLMKQVALLSTAMGPRISAAAAEAAIAAICDENPYARVMFEGEDNSVTDLSPSPTLKNELERLPSVLTETQEATSERNCIPIKLRIRAAIATALGTAAAHAKFLADQEDREIEHLVATVIETQLRKIHCKIKHFEDLELIMEKEYIHIQELKESIIADWIDVLRRIFSAGIPRWRDRTSVRSLVENVA